jgi:hypothetical protein
MDRKVILWAVTSFHAKVEEDPLVLHVPQSDALKTVHGDDIRHFHLKGNLSPLWSSCTYVNVMCIHNHKRMPV